jgi:hypothetical protein
VVTSAASFPSSPGEAAFEAAGDYFDSETHYRSVAQRIVGTLRGAGPFVLVTGDPPPSPLLLSQALARSTASSHAVINLHCGPELTLEAVRRAAAVVTRLPASGDPEPAAEPLQPAAPLFIFDDFDQLSDHQIEEICGAAHDGERPVAAGVLLAGPGFLSRLEEPALQFLRGSLAGGFRFQEVGHDESLDFLRHQVANRHRRGEIRRAPRGMFRTVLAVALSALLAVVIATLVARHFTKGSGERPGPSATGGQMTPEAALAPPKPAAAPQQSPAPPPQPAPVVTAAAPPAPPAPAPVAEATQPQAMPAPAPPPLTLPAPSPPPVTLPAPSPAAGAAPAIRSVAPAPTPAPVAAAVPPQAVPAPQPVIPPPISPPPISPLTASPPGAAPAAPPVAPAEIAELTARGDVFLAAGDITSARLFYERAADAGDGAAALRLGVTFDPIFLGRTGFRGIMADPGQAGFWYRRARDLGQAGAADRLKGLDAYRFAQPGAASPGQGAAPAGIAPGRGPAAQTH